MNMDERNRTLFADSHVLNFGRNMLECHSPDPAGITMTYETHAPVASKEGLRELVDRFHSNIRQYSSPTYNEENTRADFIDKFFALLGWDMYNTAGGGERYREVVREKSVNINGQRKAPDYAFRIGEKMMFFVEAKKPSVIIKTDASSAFQLRQYGFSRELPLSILTNFAEFAVYKTKVKIENTDTASTARIFYCRYDEFFNRCNAFPQYETNFDFIDGIFSRKNVFGEKFDDFANSDAIKRGTSPVDKELLAVVEQWRETLAINIAKRNKTLDIHRLNAAVQKIIDRILFLRIAEGRGIERHENLFRTTEGTGIYHRLQKVFTDADRKYNAGLFERCDWLESIAVDDKTLAPIIKGLYGEKCPYAFEAIPIEILGSIYERFLGKTILLATNHKVEVKDKPEVRKAGGIYYTPQYVVDYIVRETIGRKIDPVKPVPPLTLLDPACGSGSFLIGAYSYLIDAHLTYYTNSKTILKKSIKNEKIYQVGDDTYRLSIEEKRRILLENIYGVDTDELAVEVTKLSLYLKLMENETEESCENLFRYSDLKALPNLDKNIRCGNTLVGNDFYDGKNMSFWGSEDMRTVNAFDWHEQFPVIFKAGGFDIVIGNPPYVRQESLGEEAKQYFQRSYKVHHGAADLYTYFIERGINLLKTSGNYAIIVSNKWLRAKYGEPLRKWLKTQNVLEIIDFGDLPVFGKVTAYPMILHATKNPASKQFAVSQVKSLDFNSLTEHLEDQRRTVDVKSLDNAGWQLRDGCEKQLFDKLLAMGVPLKDYVRGQIFYGIKTGLNDAFVIDNATRKRLIREDKRSAKIIKPFLAGRDIKRYIPLETDKYLIFTRRGININEFPAIKAYLEQFRKQLTPKPKGWVSKDGKTWKGRKPGAYKWYEIQDTVDYYQEFDKPKIIVPAIAREGNYAFDTNGILSNDKTTIISIADKFLLALLNSKVIDFVLKSIAATKRGGYFEYKPMYLWRLPIFRIDEGNKRDMGIRDRIIELVDEMLAAQANLRESASELDRKRISVIDGQINKAVYQLYGLERDDIRIVEGKIATE